MVAVERIPPELKKACQWGGADRSPWTGLWHLHDHVERLKTQVEDSLADMIDMLNLM